MLETRKKICIAGAGGFAREAFVCLLDTIDEVRAPIDEVFVFMVEDEFMEDDEIMGVPVMPQSKFNANEHVAVVAIGNPTVRQKVADSLPTQTEWHTIIHPTAVSSQWVEIGEGSIITAGCVLTTHIDLGMHSHLNLHTTIGHDCRIGNFFTTAPGANISGNCKIGDRVYIGTNAAIKQGVTICDDVTIGMGGVVLKDITEPGVYVGNPVRKLERK